MAKTQKAAPATGETSTLPAVFKSDLTEVANIEQVLDMLDEAEKGDVLTTPFLTLEPGEEARVVITGLTEVPAMNDQPGMNDAATILFKDKNTGEAKSGVMANSVIAGFAKTHKAELPMPVLVICKGSTKNKAGTRTYTDYEIRSLVIKG